MYADLAPGDVAELDAPSLEGVDVLYSHRYVSERMRDRNPYLYGANNPVRYLDPNGLVIVEAKCNVFITGQSPGGVGATITLVVARPPAIPQNVCPPGWEFKGWSPLKGDEGAVARICAGIKPVGRCRKCSVQACEKELAKFIQAVRDTWIMNIFGLPIGSNTCERWVNDLESRLPHLFGLGDACCVYQAGLVTFKLRGQGLAARHCAYRIEFCDGTVIYADNGA
jgi:hypothetical protein